MEEFQAMQELMKGHPGGPLAKVLELLEEGGHKGFDQLHQRNIPNQVYSLFLSEHRIGVVRLPAPVRQEYIHKAEVLEEFKGYLWSLAHRRNKRTHLIINFQDRTSWREHFRCKALEELQENREFGQSLEVVTMPKDTEFYHQLAPYHKENQAKEFIRHFLEHLQDPNCGFYFPENIAKKLFPKTAKGIINAVHRIFFQKRNVLTREKRMAFIELVYLFLELKIIEITKPDQFSFCCKDGIDISPAAHVQLLLFLKMFKDEPLSEKEREELDLILYAPSLTLRERCMLPERFNRMAAALRTIEDLKEEHGPNFSKMVAEALGRYLQKSTLEGAAMFPK